MNPFSDVTQLPDDFDGLVRLFPLPGLVLFPHAMLPLHFFEPRYVEMLHESLAGDGLIAMATLLDAETGKKSTAPAISQTVCVGKIVSHAELDGDRHNILMIGVRRGQIRRELETSRSFRSAHIELIDDIYVPAAASKRTELKRRLLTSFGEIIPSESRSQQNLQELMASQMGVGPITDIIAYTLPFAPEDKLKLLGLNDVDARAKHLIDLMDHGDIDLQSVSLHEQEISVQDTPGSTDRNSFPPPFSVN